MLERRGSLFVMLSVVSTLSAVTLGVDSKDPMSHFVQVSRTDNRYFELDDGRAFIPNGLNMIAPYGDTEEGLDIIGGWIRNLGDNEGNYIRLWLSNPWFDIEHEKSGQYDTEKAKRIDAVLEIARKNNVRVKMTIEHFRHFFGKSQQWAAKPLHHESNGGPARDIDDFFQGRKSREQFKRKLDFYAERYGSDPVVFAWELWNEMDTVRGRGYAEWTEEMLVELKKRFPRNMVTQSLGSFDHQAKRDRYRRFSLMAYNDYAQVHRYLDLGASLDICHGPVDMLTADAINELFAFKPGKPVILAESGAVEPSHSGPFKLYDADKAGVILHDVLFTPFFVGSAGTGQTWHWNRYVAANKLWFQFSQFAEATRGLDPAAEGFRAITIEHPLLRIYALKGKHTFIAFCRDKANTWKSELAEQRVPSLIANAVINVSGLPAAADKPSLTFYDPWRDEHVEGQVEDNKIALPAFTRSLIVRIEY